MNKYNYTRTWNVGNQNTGNGNTGDRNAGDNNTGSWNDANSHVGCFNTEPAEKAYYFNKLIDVEVWDDALKPAWLYMSEPTAWIEDRITDAQIIEDLTFGTCGEFLQGNNMADEWAKAFASASDEEIQQVRDLPGFDATVFLEITGLDLDDKTPKNKIITIDGQDFELVPVKREKL